MKNKTTKKETKETNNIMLTKKATSKGIAEVAVFENPLYKYSTKAERSTLADILPSAPILAMP